MYIYIHIFKHIHVHTCTYTYAHSATIEKRPYSYDDHRKHDSVPCATGSFPLGLAPPAENVVKPTCRLLAARRQKGPEQCLISSPPKPPRTRPPRCLSVPLHRGNFHEMWRNQEGRPPGGAGHLGPMLHHRPASGGKERQRGRLEGPPLPSRVLPGCHHQGGRGE